MDYTPILKRAAEFKSQWAQLYPLRTWMATFWSDEPSARRRPEDDRPVFVLGAVRSGTTAVCGTLTAATAYRGFFEGHVFDAAIDVVNGINTHFDKLGQRLTPSDTKGYHLGRIPYPRVYGEALEMLRRLAAGYATPFWFDKTPTVDMIASAPILAEAWPNARFIFMKRRGMENISSRIRKFPDTHFVGSCYDWAFVMAAWRNVRDRLEDRAIELDQSMLNDDPDGGAAQIGTLLDLGQKEILTFATILRRERPEVTDPSNRRVSALSELGWSPEQIESFRTICGAEMEAYGYTYDARYRI